MDPECNLQDVVRCEICDTPVPTLHCYICDKNLCKDCVAKHLSDESTEHKVVSFESRGCITKCRKHSSKIRERYCEQCDIPICEKCASSKEHRGHELVDVMKKLEMEKHKLQKDLQELNNSILTKYQDIEQSIQIQITNLKTNSEVVKNDIDKHGEDMQNKIKSAIETIKSDLDEIDSKNLAVLNKQKDKIKNTLSEIEHSIAYAERYLRSNDVSLVISLKSKIAEFNKFPPKNIISLPRFVPRKINREWMFKKFGYLSEHSYKVDDSIRSSPTDHDHIMSSPTDQLRIDFAPTIADIETTFRMFSSMTCNNDETIWTCGYDDNILRLYELQGEIVKSIKTFQGKKPRDLAVTKNGDLTRSIYTPPPIKTYTSLMPML